MVVDGGVDEHATDPPEREPAQRVEHEGATDAGPLCLGSDSEALEESLVGIPAAHGIAAQ